MSSSVPRLVLITEYQLATHGAPVVAMTNGLAEALQRAGLATREHVVAALVTAVDLAGGASSSHELLQTAICIGGSWRDLWLEYAEHLGGYVASLPATGR